MKNFENLNLIKKNYWFISSLKTSVDRNGNIASVFLLLANPKKHQYTKKIFLDIGDFVDMFGQPSEFSEKILSAMVVGKRVEVSEFLEELEEEPIQTGF